MSERAPLVTKNPRALVLLGVLTGLLYVVNFFSGQLLTALFTIPGLSGIVTGLTVPFFLCCGYLLTRGTGSFTVMWTLYSAAAIPTLLMGPPGPYKVIIGFLAGLTFDFVVWLMKGRKLGLYVGFVFYTVVMMTLFLLALIHLDLPGFEATIVAVVVITVIFVLEGLLSVYGAIRLAPRLNRIAPDFLVTPLVP